MDTVIGTRAANALVEDAQLSGGAARAMESVLPNAAAVHNVLSAFRQAYGGLWVGGRATLTPSSLTFHPNAVNRAMQTGTLDIVVPAAAITGVQVLRGVLTKIIAVETVGGSVVKIRCFGAREFAEQIRSVAHRARGE
jgi:hypothetical protein